MAFPNKIFHKNSSNKRRKKILLWALVIFMLIGCFLLFKIFGPNTLKDDYLYIKTGSNYEQVKNTLNKESFVKDMKSFDILARKANYPNHVKAGRYQIRKGMSNYNIILLLRSGRQTPVKIIINKLRTKQDFINKISKNLEADSMALKRLLNDAVFLAQFNLDTNTALCAIIPDTYEFWWNTSADKAFKKIAKYYTAYWTDERKQKAITLGITPQEAIILASIIEEETNYNSEKDTIASVYLNRLKKGMKLQADPTAKYAYGDFTIKRITATQTNLSSPYNTYYTTGLPPGPICTPSKKSIESVLNAAKTEYLYFCAKEDFSGAHRFAITYEEHQKNAKRFQQALNDRNIH